MALIELVIQNLNLYIRKKSKNQNNLLNLCECVVNSQRLYCSRKTGIECYY